MQNQFTNNIRKIIDSLKTNHIIHNIIHKIHDLFHRGGIRLKLIAIFAGLFFVLVFILTTILILIQQNNIEKKSVVLVDR